MDILTTNASDEEKPKGHHCTLSVSSASEFAKLKFKRPKVFAIRDFPVSFKRFNAQWNGCGDDSEAEPCEADHVEPQKNILHSENNGLESIVESDDGYNSEDQDRSGKMELQYLLTKMSYSAPDFAKVKFKRRKVSAIRDFPVSFERFNAQWNGCGDDSEAEPCEADHVEPQKNILHSEKDDLESDDGYNSEDLDRSGKMELQYLLTKMSYSAPDFAKVKFKRRKVSAIRDFPVGFENFGAGRANGGANDSDEDIDEPAEIDDDHVESHQNSLHPETHELSPCLVSKVEVDVASDPEMVESEVKRSVA